MYKHIVILFFYLINDVVCLVIYDVTTQNISKHGEVEVKSYLKTANMFYIRHGSKEFCDFNFLYLNPSRFCDYDIHSLLAILKPELIGTKSPNDFAGYDKRSFDIDKYRSQWMLPVAKSFNTGSIVRFDVTDWRYVYYYEPNLYGLSTINYEYSDIIQLTTFMGDDTSEIYGYYRPYAIFTTNVFAIRTDVNKKILFTKETYVWVSASIMLEEYAILAKCNQPYYGKTCWYSCVDNERFYCNCYDKNTNAPCDLKCKPGWMTQYIIYYVDGIEVYMPRCDSMDICVHPPISKCNVSQVCLPVDNYTRFCEFIYASISNRKSDSNITSDVFLHSEIMKIQLEKSVLVQSDVGVNTTASIDVNEYVFKEEILTVVDGYDMPVVVVNVLNFIDQLMNLTITFNLQAWSRFISRNKIFRVNVAPDYIRIYHRENWTSVDFYIFIGEHLVTNTSGLPAFRSIFFWESELLNLSFNFGNEILIPREASFGLADLKCNSTLIMPKRNDGSISESFTYFVKPFQFFDWNKTNNVLEYGTTVKCQAKSFITFELMIARLKGISPVNIINDYVWLSGISGGYYELICHFLTKYGYFFTTYLRFKLRNNATEICLFLYTNTVGSIVQCDHNGNIPDEYTVNVKLYLFNGNSMDITLDRLNFLRIPYTVKFIKYKLVCNITNTINMMKINLETLNVLSFMAHGVYYVTKRNRICLKYSDYIDEPEILTHERDIFTLYHYLFYLEVPQELVNVIILLFVLFSIIPVLTGISVFAYSLSAFKQHKLLIKNITRTNNWLKKRNMQDKLKMKSRISLQAEKKNMEKYFTNNTFY